VKSGSKGWGSQGLAWIAAGLIGLALGCQGGSLRLGSKTEPTDAVHRIVARGELRVGMSGTQPPLNMKDRAGALIGLDVDLARALADAMGVELVLVERPFSQLLDGLLRSEFDLVISGLTITPERNARVAFVGPYLISGASLLTRESVLDGIDALEDLDSPDRTLAALAGSTSEQLIRDRLPAAKIVTADDPEMLVAGIRRGEVDGLIASLPYVRFELARNPDGGLAEFPSPFTIEPLGIALAPGSPLFENLVRNYLETLEYTGILIQMKSRWLSGRGWLSELPSAE
jgi:polar amino acid transport system substrate-binding protein